MENTSEDYDSSEPSKTRIYLLPRITSEIAPLPIKTTVFFRFRSFTINNLPSHYFHSCNESPFSTTIHFLLTYLGVKRIPSSPPQI
mmetsp:Transcript_24618/g.58235  ORF Transcript_24618/g.58235 Transcript_24618/m.58235 type:complete len:86 (+) Transcript_24618:73-330(+)